MAIAGVYTVKKGDTLWGIARAFGTTVDNLVKLNDIPNPDLIHVGQELRLTSSPSSNTTGNNVNKAKITAFALQSGKEEERLLYATWSWTRANTAKYKVKWTYATGDGVDFFGGEEEVTYRHYTFTPPDNAKHVTFKVKPIATTHKVNGKDTSYWTADWSVNAKFHFDLSPPLKPPVPTVTIEKFKLTASIDNLNVNGKVIQFEVVKNDNVTFKIGTASIVTTSVSFSCAVDPGAEYKVRCRSRKGDQYSAWSEYSSKVGTIPSVPKSITTIKATSETSVYLEWSKVGSAKSYKIQYATEKRYFEGSNQIQDAGTAETNHYEVTGLTAGDEYFFRVQAINDKGESSWSEIKSIKIGEPPSPPTTWSSTTTAIVGEKVNLYWSHNSADGSRETFANLHYKIGDDARIRPIKNTDPENDDDGISVYTIDTSEYSEGTTIEWRVQTAGITGVFGEYSVFRTIDVYAPPTLELNITDKDGNDIETLTSFPLYIKALAGPNTQQPIGYHLSVIANETYETVDQIGNFKMVNSGDEVYSNYFDINDQLTVALTPSSIDLENNIPYTVVCTASMDSGLTAEASRELAVAWTDEVYTPNAEISIDEDTLSANIRPYCTQNLYNYYKVNANAGYYTATTELIDKIDGEPVYESINVDGAEYALQIFTDTGEVMYKGIDTTGAEVYFYMLPSEETGLVEDVTLSVYRREYDGTFVEIATDISNTSNTYVTDPHPALDFARYRIVATSTITGAVSYYDIPGHPVGESAVVIQWAEDWTNFETTNADALEAPAWSGSMLKLPYNIDVSDKNSPDVSLVEYAGRKHPVSYYGTQVGETASWSVVVPKEDKETLYALRRLKIWMGDVYVREPSGSGYWANINVTFNQKHLELLIPVTIEIIRVEGGI